MALKMKTLVMVTDSTELTVSKNGVMFDNVPEYDFELTWPTWDAVVKKVAEMRAELPADKPKAKAKK